MAPRGTKRGVKQVKVALALVVCLAILLGWTPKSAVSEARVTRQREFAIDSKTTILEIETYNGSITWQPGSEAKITVKLSVQGFLPGAMGSYLEEIDVLWDSTGSRARLAVRRPRWRWGVISSNTAITVQLPADQLEALRATTSNGTIVVADAKANLDLTTSNGSIEVLSFKGDISLRSSNGRLLVQRGVGRVNLRTSNGAISLDGVTITDSSTVRTSNGAIRGKVDFAGRGQHTFETSNGSVNLKVPAGTQGRFELGTSNESAVIDLGGNHIRGRRVETTIGDDGVTVRIRTSNGGISVVEM